MLSHFSCIPLSVTPWTVAHQAPLSLGFSRQECWSGLPCPPPGKLPHPGMEPGSPMSPALAGGFFTATAAWKAQSFYPVPKFSDSCHGSVLCQGNLDVPQNHCWGAQGSEGQQAESWPLSFILYLFHPLYYFQVNFTSSKSPSTLKCLETIQLKNCTMG